MRRSMRLVAALSCAGMLLTACAGAVKVKPNPATASSPGCAKVLAALPEMVDGAKKRATTPATAAAAAWGKTPIVLTCGVPIPRALGPTSELITINDIDWFAQQLSGGYRFTLVHRTPRVQVDVPAKYKPETDAVVDLTGAIKKSTTVTTAL